MFPMHPDPEAVGGHRRERATLLLASSPRATSFATAAWKSARASAGGLIHSRPREPSTATMSPGADLLRGPARADHRRGAPGAGDDGGVAGRAADVGDEGRHPAGAGQHRRVGGREVVGDDHRPLGDLLLHVHHLPEEVPHHPVGDEVHVGAALAEVLVLDLVEEVLDLPGHPAHRPLGVDPVVGDELVHLVDQHRVTEHQPMRLEDQGVVLAVALLQPLLQLHQLVLGEVDGGLEPHQLRAPPRSRRA